MADFAELKEKVSIEQAVEMLGLEVTKSGAQLRAPCPACGNGGSRALAITPAKNLAYCFSAGVGGDVLFLASHVDKCSLVEAGNRLADYFKIGQKKPHVPQAEKKTTRETTRAPFDPVKFGADLKYGPEVEALGYSEQEAADFGIGSHRGAVYKAARYASGVTAGFWKYQEGRWVAPKQWLPDVKPDNVIPLRQRA